MGYTDRYLSSAVISLSLLGALPAGAQEVRREGFAPVSSEIYDVIVQFYDLDAGLPLEASDPVPAVLLLHGLGSDKDLWRRDPAPLPHRARA